MAPAGVDLSVSDQQHVEWNGPAQAEPARLALAQPLIDRAARKITIVVNITFPIVFQTSCHAEIGRGAQPGGQYTDCGIGSRIRPSRRLEDRGVVGYEIAVLKRDHRTVGNNCIVAGRQVELAEALCPPDCRIEIESVRRPGSVGVAANLECQGA